VRFRSVAVVSSLLFFLFFVATLTATLTAIATAVTTAATASFDLFFFLCFLFKHFFPIFHRTVPAIGGRKRFSGASCSVSNNCSRSKWVYKPTEVGRCQWIVKRGGCFLSFLSFLGFLGFLGSLGFLGVFLFFGSHFRLFGFFPQLCSCCRFFFPCQTHLFQF